MKRRIRPILSALALGLALIAGSASGQIGTDIRNAFSAFGPATGITTNEDGDRLLDFRKDGARITVVDRQSVAIRIIYQKPALAEADILRWLEANRGNADWAPWSTPGAEQTNTAAAWLRADESAMASRNGIEFTVTAAAWNHAPDPANRPASPAPPAASATNTPPASDTAALPAVEPPAPPPPPPPPRPRPAKPLERPRPGDTRARAESLLGPPSGEARTGPHLILLYPWGQVILQNGYVKSVE